jgi:dynein heavy chain
MKHFEERMMRAVRLKIARAYKHLCIDNEGNTDRNTWVFQHPSQSVAVTDQIVFTEYTEHALSNLEDDPFAVEDYFEALRDQLNEFVELIRGQLSTIQRKTLVALITQDVHARDIIEELQAKKVQTVFDFLWVQ